MSGDSTRWELLFTESGLDNIGGKLSGIASQLLKLGDSYNKHVDRELAYIEAAVTIGFEAIKSGATAAAAALADLDGKAVKAFGERTATLRAYTTILGDARQAHIEYGKANELASKTELTSASTLKAQQALIVAGFRGADLTNALTASMDVASTKQPEERELTMERMGRAFSQILAAGKLRGQELNQLAEAGVNRGQVLELLGKGNSAAGEKAMSSGQVTAQQGITAVQQAILQTLGTQKLGQFATGAAGSLAGVLSNRDEALDILLKSFEGETLPALEEYKMRLTEQTALLATSSETGKGLVMMLSDFASITTNVKALWTDFSTGFLETFVSSYNAARENSGAFVSMTDGVKALGQTLGKVGGFVGTLADGFERLLAVISPLATFLVRVNEALNEFEQAQQKDPTAIFANLKNFGKSFSAAMHGDTGPKTLADYQAEDDAAEAHKFDLLLKDQQWHDFKQWQAEGSPGDAVAKSAVTTKWGKGGKAKNSGYDVSGLLGGSGGVGDMGGSSDSSGHFQASIDAAAAVSSAPSAQMQAMSAGGSAGASTGSDVNVTVAAGAIVVNGVSDPTAAAQEVMRLLGQTLGRVHRAPSVRTGL
jgi:tape measure domain-containing protein